MKFEKPFKYMRLYSIRNYLYQFSGNRIDFIVAGKNSFQPFMGQRNFLNSPSGIMFINLNPLELMYIEKVCLYDLVIKNSEESYLKDYLLKLKNKKSKENFNILMKEFYFRIEYYTGGHPRMVSRLLDFLHMKNIDYSQYFEKNKINNLFIENENEFLDSIDNDVLKRFIENLDLIFSISNVLKEEQYELAQSLTYMIFFFKNEPNLIFQFLDNILSKYNVKSDIKLNPKDILDSIGILYIDKQNILSQSYHMNNQDIKNNLKLFFPQYLIKYLSKKIFTEDQLVQKLLLLNNLPLTLSRENMEKIVIDYYFHIFQFKIKSALSHLFLDNDNYLEIFPYIGYTNVQVKYIDGSKGTDSSKDISVDEKNNIRKDGYVEDISKQIKNLYEFGSFDDVLIIIPNNPANYAHDFFILTANEKDEKSKRKLFSFQVDTKSFLDKKKISNGYETCLKLEEKFNNIKVEYFFITHLSNIKFSFNVERNYNIIQNKLLSSLMIENNNIKNIQKKSGERRKNLTINHPSFPLKN